MKQDDAKQLAEQGLRQLNEALRQGKSEALERYLTVMARFHKYSFHNSLMIALQNAQASLVAGFRKWHQLGRHVRKGEKGIAIFAPITCRRKTQNDEDGEVAVATLRGFRIVHVFDISQTEGDDLPQFSQALGDPGQYIAQLESLIRHQGIALQYDALPFGVKGESHEGRIVIQADLLPAEHLAILAHELGHELLHKGARRHETTKTVRETEAEAVAFVVCRACGVDTSTRSADYIQLYRGDTDTLAESLAFIQKTAAHILAHLLHTPSQEVAV